VEVLRGIVDEEAQRWCSRKCVHDAVLREKREQEKRHAVELKAKDEIVEQQASALEMLNSTL
jgi:hypothetical protein